METWVVWLLVSVIVLLVIGIYVAWTWQQNDYNEEKLIAVPFPTNVWGPRFWFVLHTVAAAMSPKPSPDEQKNIYDFVVAFGKVLPCPICRQHFAQNISQDKVVDALTSRDDFMEWVWRVHNKVNVDTGKKPITRAEAVRYFKKLQHSGH